MPLINNLRDVVLQICYTTLGPRPPDEIIGTNYLHRWHILPRNRFFNIYLHKYHGSDDGRALHDHPWPSISFLLRGELKEYHLGGVRVIHRFLPVFRSAKFTHRLDLLKGPALTVFITGPRVRSWGFHVGGRWVHWEEYTSTDGRNIEA